MERDTLGMSRVVTAGGRENFLKAIAMLAMRTLAAFCYRELYKFYTWLRHSRPKRKFLESNDACSWPSQSATIGPAASLALSRGQRAAGQFRSEGQSSGNFAPASGGLFPLFGCEPY
jgi:hypothetical protein